LPLIENRKPDFTPMNFGVNLIKILITPEWWSNFWFMILKVDPIISKDKNLVPILKHNNTSTLKCPYTSKILFFGILALTYQYSNEKQLI